MGKLKLTAFLGVVMLFTSLIGCRCSAFAQESPLNIIAVFSTVSAYPPPQYIIAGTLPGTNGGYIGWGVTIQNGEEPVYGDVETEVTGMAFSGPMPTSIACQRLDNYTSPVTVSGKQQGPGKITPPSDQTALYACAVYTNPAGEPVPATPPAGGCQTNQGIWNLVEAQTHFAHGTCYTVGEVCYNNVEGTPDVDVIPDAQGCTHYTVIHAFDANDVPNNPDCCQVVGSCVAGSGCLPPPNSVFCQRACDAQGM